MKKEIILLLIWNIYCFGQNPNGLDTAWVSSFGGRSIDIGRDIKETSDKGFIIGGTTSSFGDGNTSFYLIKTDSLGFHEWSKSLGSPHNDFCYSIEIANDGGFLLSGFTNHQIEKGYDGYLIKTDSIGNLLWTKNYGGADWDFIYNSCLMPDGGLLLCGETKSNSFGGSDGFLVRTNNNGDTLWTKKIGATGEDAFYSVEQSNNRIYVVGKFHDVINDKSLASIYKLDFNGNVLDQNFFSGANSDPSVYNDLFITSDSEILLCGKHGTTTLGNHLLRRVDTTNFTQIYYNTSPQDYYIRCVTEGYNKEVFTMSAGVGGVGGTIALYMRWDSAFAYLNGAPFGGSLDEEGYEIIKTSKGYAFVGSTYSYGNQNGSIDENVYLVVFNKRFLQNEFFLLINEFQDNLSMVGITKINNGASEALIYPNPVKSDFIIRFKDNSYNGATLNYELYDVSGIKVDENLFLVRDNQIVLSKKNLQSGLYFFKLSLNNNFISTGKIAIE